MPNFELFIRPWQTRDITPPRRIVKPDAKPVENVVITVDAEGEAKIFHGSYNQTMSTYQDATHKEHERSTTTVDIKNPDDADQHVKVEAIDKLTTKSGSGKYYQKSNFKYKNTENG